MNIKNIRGNLITDQNKNETDQRSCKSVRSHDSGNISKNPSQNNSLRAFPAQSVSHTQK